ncbi:MAG: AMP-binding protein, partial [bacterium]
MNASDIIWRPDEDLLQNSHIARFMKKMGFTDHRKFLAWSVEEHARFWEAVIEDMGLAWYKPYDRLLDMSEGFPWAKWFLGGETNIVLNCIDRHLDGPARDRTALIWEGDDGAVRRHTFAELSAEVSRLANAMRAMGMKPGDTAGVFMPLIPEAAIAMYACLKIGVAMIPVFSGFGPQGLAERLAHAKARILFTANGALRRGKVTPLKSTVDAALAIGTAVEKVVVVERADVEVPMTEGRDTTWSEFISGQPAEAETERLGSDAVSLILYTSGTTGKP